ncbi:uncharacterized protein LAESUDRAFT_730984 [Laetiporus sulphureus 93-53]|uniref:Uncharacterized protein n=1 Tax=Laetiporus sulphureus 93-53 TaxID=1314785 RepID=A0A165BV09_9APHY|nr:uncharacterized protein LAESUDRAFT_730984 [Laetiporus sulphureus 93-53]KZT01706.1 hypothetical protein LAESUDRAFT_730984 [Laetiporus sulphureus 93-53]
MIRSLPPASELTEWYVTVTMACKTLQSPGTTTSFSYHLQCSVVDRGPPIHQYLDHMTLSSFGGEQIMDIQVTISALPTIDCIYNNEIMSGSKQVHACTAHHDSASLNVERTRNVRDF